MTDLAIDFFHGMFLGYLTCGSFTNNQRALKLHAVLGSSVLMYLLSNNNKHAIAELEYNLKKKK